MSVDTIDRWDWIDEEQIPDGYDWKTIPKCTQRNFILLAEKVNELIEEVNRLTPPKEATDENA